MTTKEPLRGRPGEGHGPGSLFLKATRPPMSLLRGRRLGFGLELALATGAPKALLPVTWAPCPVHVPGLLSGSPADSTGRPWRPRAWRLTWLRGRRGSTGALLEAPVFPATGPACLETETSINWVTASCRGPGLLAACCSQPEPLSARTTAPGPSSTHCRFGADQLPLCDSLTPVGSAHTPLVPPMLQIARVCPGPLSTKGHFSSQGNLSLSLWATGGSPGRSG